MPSTHERGRSVSLEEAALREEEIKKATIGSPTVINDQIKLVDYDPEWPRRFEREAARVRETLGDRALRIEHVGSTSVAGLVAKPIVARAKRALAQQAWKYVQNYADAKTQIIEAIIARARTEG